MSHSDKHVFDPDCPGCRPAILDWQTQIPLPDDHPMVVAITEVWKISPRDEQEAYHQVMVNNSRDEEILTKCQRIVGRMQEALNAIKEPSDAN